MSDQTMKWNTERDGPSGFTMVEMLVVVCLLLLLIPIIALAFSASRCCHYREHTTRLQADGILSSLSRYRMNYDSYPPSTGAVNLAAGTTKPFAPGETAEADAICKYLGQQVTQPEFIRTVKRLRIVVDQWGHPFRMDIMKDPANPQKMLARVWSLGPDGQEGPVPFSRVQTITDPRDEDNISSWR